jgi:hypothetical protein
MEKETIGTHNPSILQRDHVIDIQIRRSRPHSPIVRRRPTAGRRSAGRVDRDGGSIPLQHVLACVAGAGDDDPGREKITVVRAVVNGRSHRETGQKSLGCCRGGDAGLVGGGWSAYWETCRGRAGAAAADLAWRHGHMGGMSLGRMSESYVQDLASGRALHQPRGTVQGLR